MTVATLVTAPPEALGLCASRWQAVLQMAARFCDQDRIPALSLQVQRRGLTTGVHPFGRRQLSRDDPINEQTLFLIASLTKPLLAMATLMLVERGQLTLNDRVSDLLPEFRGGDKRVVTLRHLLTHTSGLPDMLPNNAELREAHAPLSQFVSETCTSALAFPPGRTAQYQSMGYALLGSILDRLTGEPHSEFLRREMFAQLGMTRTWLGLSEDQAAEEDIAEVRVPEWQKNGESWNWNSRYWRCLGAPWGGAYSTVGDLSHFCRSMLNGGGHGESERLFSPVLLREATTNRLPDFANIDFAEQRTRGWGYGWRMNWKDHRGSFGDLLPADVFGHWGATGTLCWVCPRREIAVVLLSTQPAEGSISPLVILSNMIVASFVDA